MRRLAALTVLGALVAVPSSASAAGVGGVELVPDGGTSFHLEVRPDQTASAGFTLRNLTDAPAEVRLYAAAAARTGGDGWAVSGPGSASWLQLDDQTVALGPGEQRQLSFTVTGDGTERTGAVVVEQTRGNVAQRAATLVYAQAASPVPLPLLLIGLALLLVVVAAVAVAATARRRDAGDAPAEDERVLQPA